MNSSRYTIKMSVDFLQLGHSLYQNGCLNVDTSRHAVSSLFHMSFRVSFSIRDSCCVEIVYKMESVPRAQHAQIHR